jgi:ADP-ribosylglycohydrolase
MDTHTERMNAARLALEGLSVGDAFGRSRIAGAEWRYSDDTEMASAIFETLQDKQTIDQDALAAAFAARFKRDPERGYGAMAYWLLHQLAQGRDWRAVSKEVFRGQGSLGNGAAMRAAPIGAYFAEDPTEVARQAQLSAAITHAHPDGQAGAVAVAVAASVARLLGRAATPDAVFDAVLKHTPDGPTREGLERAATGALADATAAAVTLGDGALVRSSDTVPLSIWCAAHHLNDYRTALEVAMEACVRPAADRDTVGAIVGSIVVLSAGFESIPREWHHAREPLLVRG